MKTIEDLNKIMNFFYEIDGLKRVFRRTKITNEDRFENDAEHSFHVAVMAIILRDFFDDSYGEIDELKAIKMLLMHDAVELYAGDTYCYDEKAGLDKFEREIKAADELFGLLPNELGEELKSLWLEFDEEKTTNAKFAAFMDKLQPLLLNYKNEGLSWIENNVTKSMVLKRMKNAIDFAPETLLLYINNMIDDCVERRWLIDK